MDNCRNKIRVYLECGFVIAINDLLLETHAKIIQDLNGYAIEGISNSAIYQLNTITNAC